MGSVPVLTVADIDKAVAASPAIGISAAARLTKRGYSLNCNPLKFLVELRGLLVWEISYPTEKWTL